jgi:3-hydroxyisobutyrate dehydrogenase-like beta-hydroxyacid dehydrogenase
MKAAFLGLGAMGAPIARTLLEAGHQLTVWNRTPRPLSGAQIAATPLEAAAGAEAVLTMLADDRAVEEVIATAQLSPGQVHVSMSTISVALARRLAENQAMVSAPVFGRPEAAAARKLWVLVAGRPALRARVEPLLEPIGQGVLVVGDDPPLANVVKLAGNFFIAATIDALGEAFSLAEQAGLPRQQLLTLLSRTLFRAPIAETYATLIAERRYQPAGFRAALGRKDLQLVLELARLPLAELVDRHLASLPPELDWAAAGDLGLTRNRS